MQLEITMGGNPASVESRVRDPSFGLTLSVTQKMGAPQIGRLNMVGRIDPVRFELPIYRLRSCL